MIQNKVIAVQSCPVWLPQTQTWLYNQVKFLPEDFEIHVICDRTENLDQFYVSNIHCLRETTALRYYLEKGIRKLFFPKYRPFLTTNAKNIKAQILHSHFGPNGWMDIAAAKRTGLKHLVTFYGYDVNELPSQDKRWLSRYKELFHAADAFIFEGPFMARQVEKLGCPAEKIHVHHLGIPIDAIKFIPRYFQAGDTLRVLIAASFNEKKGIPYALEALVQLQNITSLEITIIGDSNSDPRSEVEKHRIFDIIKRGGLESKTKFLGFQPYSVLFAEAYKHHVFLSPSVTASYGDTEGGAPVTIIEMIATGMPVVSTNHCDIPEVVQYGFGNWLVDERDVNGLFNRLNWLVDHPEKWESSLQFGRKHVEKEFNARLQGERLAKIYSDVLKR